MKVLTVKGLQLVTAHDFSCPIVPENSSAYVRIDPVHHMNWPSSIRTNMCRYTPPELSHFSLVQMIYPNVHCTRSMLQRKHWGVALAIWQKLSQSARKVIKPECK